MSRVNLFVIGVRKTGTSWLHSLLGKHPDIFMSDPKELYYFGEVRPLTPPSLEVYHDHFPFDADYRYYGESTPLYFLEPEIGAEIQDYNPDAKLLALVRDPIERTVSQYRYRKQLGQIPEEMSLTQALRGDYPYLIADSHYERTLPPFADRFGPEQFRIASLERLLHEPDAQWTDLLTFLDLPPTPFPEHETRPENPTGSRSFRRLYRSTVRPLKFYAPGLYKWMTQNRTMGRIKRTLLTLLGTAESESLSSDLRQQLREEFAPTYRYLTSLGLDYEFSSDRSPS